MDPTENDDELKAEITRCICGHEELQPSQIHNLHRQRKNFDPDFFIQCDSCHVWQHGYCVGILNDQEAPEGYYCEKCRPDYHVIVVRPSGRTSKYSPQEYSDEEEDEESKAPPPKETGREERASRQRKEKEVTVQEPDHDEPSRTTNSGNNNSSSSRRDRKRRLTVNSTRDEAAYEETLRRVLEESVHDDDHRDAKSAPEGAKTEAAASTTSAPTASTLSSRSKKRRTESPSGSDESAKTSTSSSKRVAKNNNNSSNSKQTSNSTTSHAVLSNGKGSTSTAVAVAVPAAPASPNTQTTVPKKPEKRKRRHNASDDHNSTPSQSHPSAASGKSYIDKPSKPRIPQSRISIPEMQKRVAAIVEFIARTRIDLDVEERERRQLLDIRLVRYKQLYKPKENEAGNGSVNGNSSGNGTVAVDSRSKAVEEEDSHLNDPKFSSLVDGFSKSLALMNTLTAKLSDWEERYGAFGK